jgi:cellulose synthase/poly-beta-1,6-N-acetylglucosamine synthase-like glycosyltransferase
MIEPASVLEIPLVIGLLALSILSLNLAAITVGRLIAPARVVPHAELDPQHLPQVLVQLPLYNEGDLVRRILGAVAALDWPRDRLEIQVLDDSTDGSDRLSERAVAELKDQGFAVELVHRTRRTAYKAGALAAGLTRTAARYVAIFDADFIPPPDFLRRTVAVLEAGPQLAFVQARWTHLNARENLLTRAQSRLLDGHFRVEQEARWRLGLPVPFNGTCGLWRRAAIAAAGGWQGDTLTEDLDLSLRARLQGWRSVYLLDLEVPGSLPTSVPAWRAQQFRWTKGFAQCALKLTPLIWRSPVLPLWQKVLVTLQMGQPLAFVTGVACTLLGLPYIAGAVTAGIALKAAAVWASLAGILGSLSFLAAGVTRETAPGAPREIVSALFLSTGLLISNARAGLEALLGHRSEFVRTPKGQASTRAWRRLYGLIEVGAGLGLLAFALSNQPLAVFYLTLVIGGLLGLGLMQLFDGRDPLKLVRAWR